MSTESSSQIYKGLRTTAAGATAAGLVVLLSGAGTGTAFAVAAADDPHDTGDGYVMVEDNGPAWVAPAGTTAEELREREWFVREEDGIFYYEKHRWEEQRRAAEHQYLRTVTTPAITKEVPVYRVWSEHLFEIQQPYWTVESKEIRVPESAPAALMQWLDRIEAVYVGDGWWHLPEALVNSIPGFNPITVADTGWLNVSVYGGPNEWVWYSKTEVVLTDPGDFTYAVKQTQQLFWDGTWWTANRGEAAWVRMEDAPYAGRLLESREHREQDGTEIVTVEPGRSETFYATADGETTEQDEAAWFAVSPGEKWTRFGERRLPEWDDAALWNQVPGRDWKLGIDPGPQPDYFDGYDSETQRFRPVVDAWKLTLAQEPGDPVDPADPTPPADPVDPDPENGDEDTTTDVEDEANGDDYATTDAEDDQEANGEGDAEQDVNGEDGATDEDATEDDATDDDATDEAESEDATDEDDAAKTQDEADKRDEEAAAFETGGRADDSGLGAPAIAGLIAAGVLVVGGITVPYFVMRRRKAQEAGGADLGAS